MKEQLSVVYCLLMWTAVYLGGEGIHGRYLGRKQVEAWAKVSYSHAASFFFHI